MVLLKGKWSRGKIFLLVALVVVYIVPLVVAVSSLVTQSIPFSFDAARDFVQAISGKLSLIGPPTGIPGIFYGPYWIWLIQTAFIVSKNPAVVAAVILTVPYFIILPFLLFRLSRLWGAPVSVIIWLLFMLRYNGFTTSLWNPNLAPLLLWILAYCALQFAREKRGLKEIALACCMGIIAGLMCNVHLSFGLGVTAATALYTVFISANKPNQSLSRLTSAVVLFGAGVTISYLPFIVFEIRHGFGQTSAIIDTLKAALIYHRASVGHTGLHPEHIVNRFFTVTPSEILGMPRVVSNSLLLAGISVFGFRVVTKKEAMSYQEKALLLFVLMSAVSILTVFLRSVNPVWEYHFIGVESLWLIIIGLLLHHTKTFRYVFVMLATVAIVQAVSGLYRAVHIDTVALGGLSAKRIVVNSIYKDAKEPFAISAYSPSIYTYDYDYLTAA